MLVFTFTVDYFEIWFIGQCHKYWFSFGHTKHVFSFSGIEIIICTAEIWKTTLKFIQLPNCSIRQTRKRPIQILNMYRECWYSFFVSHVTRFKRFVRVLTSVRNGPIRTQSRVKGGGKGGNYFQACSFIKVRLLYLCLICQLKFWKKFGSV